jgi:ABC-type nitrate/sulfonate/bicarbonate transport system substrate-binding protein
VVAVLSATTAACGTSSASQTADGKTVLRYQGYAGQVSLPELAADLGYFKHINLKWVGNTISGPQDIQSAATGQTDFGGAFYGAISKLITSGAPITSVISYYGSDDKIHEGFYVLAGSPIKNARDLIGKKVGMNTVGGNAEAVLDAYLRKNGLSDGQVKQVQPVVLPPVNTEEALRKHQIDVAVLSSILEDKALGVGGIRLLFSDSSLFGNYSGGGYVFRKSFIHGHPDAVRDFVTGVAKAIEWARSTPREQVVARETAIVKKRGRNESAATLSYFKSYGVPNKGGIITDADLSRWFPWLEEGGVSHSKLQPGDFYTNQFNPYAGTS